MPKKSALSGKALSVLGPVDPATLGPTQTHEHLVISLENYFVMPEEASLRGLLDAPVTMENRARIVGMWQHNRRVGNLLDVQAAIEEAMHFKLAGGGTIVDATSIGIGRDPLALARISRATGLNVIMGGSYYTPTAHPPDMDQRSEDSLAEGIIRDITVGVGDTGVRSGIIGEVGCIHPLTKNLHKVLRASARAHIETGAPILIHPGHDQRAPIEILEVLAEAGADKRGVIMGHLEHRIWDLGILRELAQAGSLLEFDVFGLEDTSYGVHLKRGVPSDVQRMEMVEFLVREGHGGQIVFAQDHCQLWQWVRYGGKGYGHILENIVPRLRKRGLTEAELHAILVDNPRRVLTFR
ncbi:MAG: aryldialkylphosphatase [SAR202 cluster bacterium]|nr:aryldialkylphosphatase [SAR202 cluster bacterium]